MVSTALGSDVFSAFEQKTCLKEAVSVSIHLLLGVHGSFHLGVVLVVTHAVHCLAVIFWGSFNNGGFCVSTSAAGETNACQRCEY